MLQQRLFLRVAFGDDPFQRLVLPLAAKSRQFLADAFLPAGNSGADRQSQLLVAGITLHRRRHAAVKDQPPPVQQQQSLAELLHHRQVVRRDQQGDLLRYIDVFQHLDQLADGDDVQPDRRFVKEQQLRPWQQCRRQRAAHPLPQTQRPHRLVEQFVQCKHRIQLGQGFCELRRRNPVEILYQIKRFLHRQVPPQVGPLAEDHADLAADLAPPLERIQPQHPHFARIRPDNAGQHFDQRRLAGAVRPDQSGDFTCLDGKAERTDRLMPPVLAVEKAGPPTAPAIAHFRDHVCFFQLPRLNHHVATHLSFSNKTISWLLPLSGATRRVKPVTRRYSGPDSMRPSSSRLSPGNK